MLTGAVHSETAVWTVRNVKVILLCVCACGVSDVGEVVIVGRELICLVLWVHSAKYSLFWGVCWCDRLAASSHRCTKTSA